MDREARPTAHWARAGTLLCSDGVRPYGALMRVRMGIVVGLLLGVGVPVAVAGPTVSAAGQLGPGERRCFAVAGSAGDAAIVNLTPVEASAPGYGQLVSSSVTNPPTSSNVNYRPGSFDPNVAVAPIGADGQVCYVNSNLASVHLVADHLGTIPASGFTPASADGAPSRKVDTRNSGIKVAAGGRLCFAVTGAAGDAAVVNLTPVDADGPGNGQLVSSDVTQPPVASNVNYLRGSIDPNVAIAPIGSDGQVCYVNAALASVHLIADHLGTIAANVYAAPTLSGAPSRRVDTRAADPGAHPLLSQLVVAAQNTTVDYDRDSWDPSADVDNDCQNTRAEVLIRDSLTGVTFTTEAQCVVATGSWYDGRTDLTFTDAGDVQIDHTVALANAHRSGGWAWTAEQKRQFANDITHPEALAVVQIAANSSKGDKGPEDWEPSHLGAWCGFATDWANIKTRWSLTVTAAEHAALDLMLGTCDNAAPAAGGRVAPAERRCFAVAGMPGDAAVVNLTPVEADGPGNGQLVASDVPTPLASNVNFFPGTFDPNVAVAPLGPDGRVCYANSVLASVHLIADHLGTITSSAYIRATPSGAPLRTVDTRTETPPPPPPPTTTTSPPPPPPPGTTTTTTVPVGTCHPSYPTVCIPPPPPDLDCADVPYRNFTVLQPDPHNFDGNNDGAGCEN
jgi:hypothetical protein